MVRLSGAGVVDVARKILKPVPSRAGHATRCDVHEDQTRIDEVVAVMYHAPRSFTGEDMLEITTHGGSVVPRAVLATVVRAGARMAAPGEFTRRAVLNGKLDLLQAEAVADLIDARSTAAHRMALQQLDGGLSRRVALLREELLALEALLAYDIDFPEEDDGPVPRVRIDEATQHLKASLGALLATSTRASLVRDGALVVMAGAPNAGKSSLFNALLGEARAIVTEIPGTTRDAIEAVLDVPGWPLRLVDTAGLRETAEPVERLGIETATRYLHRAAVILHCIDARDEHAARHAALDDVPGEVLVVRTKADLVTNRTKITGEHAVSAVTGEGLRALLETIERHVAGASGQPDLDNPSLTSARHEVAVRHASDELNAFLDAWEHNTLPAIVAATHVRTAAHALGELIGAVEVDDVLDVVFRTFCVGK